MPREDDVDISWREIDVYATLDDCVVQWFSAQVKVTRWQVLVYCLLPLARDDLG